MYYAKGMNIELMLKLDISHRPDQCHALARGQPLRVTTLRFPDHLIRVGRYSNIYTLIQTQDFPIAKKASTAAKSVVIAHWHFEILVH